MSAEESPVSPGIPGALGEVDKHYKAMRAGANWFFWIAGLSLVNSVIQLSGSDRSFIIGLGITQVVDAIAAAIVAEMTSGQMIVRGIAFVFDVGVAGAFVLVGWLAGMRKGWAFLLGMTVYLLDGLIFLLVGDWLGLGFHVFALVCIGSGYAALGKLRAAEAEAARTPQTSDGLSADRILPRVTVDIFSAKLLRQEVSDDQMPIIDPIAGDLAVVYVFDLPQGFVMVSEMRKRELGLTTGQLRQVALQNLRRQMPGISRRVDPPLMAVVTGNHLEACVLLLNEFWCALASEMPGGIVVSVPHRDVLLVTSADSEQGLARLREVTDDAFGREPTHSLSADLFRWTGTGWEVFA